MNEWISLSVLSVVRAMIAQWENEWISLSALPVVRVMIAQWENECITVCPLRGPGDGSSVGEWMNLTVCAPCGPGHNRSVGKWMYLTVCPPHSPGSIHSLCGVFQGIFPWLITLWQPVMSQRGKKWLNLPSMTPHNLWTVRRKAEVQPRTDNGWGGKENVPCNLYSQVVS